MRVREKMANRQVISREDHSRFVDSLARRADSRYFLFSVDGVPAGVLDFTHIDPLAKTCEPGMYVGDERFLGMGIPVCCCALAYAFDKLNCERLTGTIRKDNPVSYQLGKRIFGAVDTGETEEMRLVEFRRGWWNSHRRSLVGRLRENYGIEEIVWP